MSKLIALALAAALGTACVGQASLSAVSVNVADPNLVALTDPELRVVADADAPVFFHGNAFWLFHDGGWYKSMDYRGGWVQVATPPDRIRVIEQPYAYVHYRQNQENASLEPRERRYPTP